MRPLAGHGRSDGGDLVHAAQVVRQANLLAWHHNHRAHGLVLDQVQAVSDSPDALAFWRAVELHLRPAV